MTNLYQDGDVDSAIELASRLLLRSQELQTPEEKRQQAELDRMIQHPDDKATLVQWTDQAFRTQTPSRVADQLTHILDVQGIPRFFSPLDQTLLRGFQSFGGYLPGVSVPMVKSKMRRETANVILPAEDDLLPEYLEMRQRDGIRMNVNFLGESLLGETEAKQRLKKYIHALACPQIECVSVKISTLYSQISSLASQHTVNVLADRMELLYRASLRNQFRYANGSSSTKFVYLDMEEYRDMRLTADVLKQSLDRDGLESVRAGIALQAYLPDSYKILEELADWAKRRTASGGTPLTIRLVKGANLEMERVDASINGWPQAPFEKKIDTDANYKKMLHRLLQLDLAKSVRIGVASHNLFDIALAMLWTGKAQAFDRVQFEMLEGMANHQRRAVFELTHSMLLYAPACKREDFLNAIGYLIRRLDENTGPSNFLRHTFQLSLASPVWSRLVADFRDACEHRISVPSQPRRSQDRRSASVSPVEASHWERYRNEPDTDWTLPVNVQWIEGKVNDWINRCDDLAPDIPLVFFSRESYSDRSRCGLSFDPSRPSVVACRFAMANEADVDLAIECGKQDPSGWRTTSFADRHRALRLAANHLRNRRGDLIAAAIADGGKTVKEADPEVSEAIDFTEFYPLTVKRFIDASCEESQDVEIAPRGLVVVVSPWNFPIAIPCGGIAAALAAGNTVILKPSSDTVLPAYLVCQCFWDAGIPREALQFVPCESIEAASHLVSHQDVATVILTGGTATARSILQTKPHVDLIAETGGKNATVVTALSDREQAIKNVVASAFGHAGQKCSATSLLLLEQEVFEDKKFQEMLADAVRSLRVGSAWDLSSRVGPLIRPPQGHLARGISELDGDEFWLVQPQPIGDHPNLFSPGVKWNVQPGSFSHQTELFGPVLSVISFRKLDEAIEVVNSTGYGLTSGLESLDDREQLHWRDRILAGNLYINRGTTGAVVLRQPFGGVGQSSYGPGLKAGGPNYVVTLIRFTERSKEHSTGVSSSPQAQPTDEMLIRMLEECELAVADGELSEAAFRRIRDMTSKLEAIVAKQYCGLHDTVQLLGQDNLRRYLPVSHLRVRLLFDDKPDDVVIAAVASLLTQCRTVFSYNDETSLDAIDLLHRVTESWAGRIETVDESDEELIVGGGVDRLRLLQVGLEFNEAIRNACIERFVPLLAKPVVASAFIEPLWFLQEQSISHDYHRYGNLGRRAGEKRLGASQMVSGDGEPNSLIAK